MVARTHRFSENILYPRSFKHRTDPEHFGPYLREEVTLSRPWVLPGTPGLEHRIGGLAKQDVTGNISYAPNDNEHMVKLRAEKVQRLQNTIPEQTVYGPEEGDLLVIGWGSMTCSWMNDSGFWVVSRLGGLTERETLRSWTVMLTAVSLVGFVVTFIASKVLPFV